MSRQLRLDDGIYVIRRSRKGAERRGDVLSFESLGAARRFVRRLWDVERNRPRLRDLASRFVPAVRRRGHRRIGPNLVQQLSAVIASGRLEVRRVWVRRVEAVAARRHERTVAESDSETPKKYELVELCEVHMAEGVLTLVRGIGGESSEISMHGIERTERLESGAFKQFINLEKFLDADGKPRADHGRRLMFAARIDWSGPRGSTLSGRTIRWKLTQINHDGAGRPEALGHASEKAKLGSVTVEGNTAEWETRTRHDGWAVVGVRVSSYAGDQFVLEASTDPEDSHVAKQGTKTTEAFVVWRKFWYQMTYRKGADVPGMNTAEKAFEAVGADMIATAPAELDAFPDETLVPKNLLYRSSSETDEVMAVHPGNAPFFHGKLVRRKTEPVKAHIVVCDYPFAWKSNPGWVHRRVRVSPETVDLPLAVGDLVFPRKTSAKSLASALITGSWLLDPGWRAAYEESRSAELGRPDWPAPSFRGPIPAANVEIPTPRNAMNRVRVTLPSECPDPAIFPIFVRLRLNIAMQCGGYSSGGGFTVAALSQHKPKKNIHLAHIIAHELGHAFEQVRKFPISTSLKAHDFYYDDHDGHGGQGPHCAFGVSEIEKPNPAAGYPNGRYVDGTCIMFHQVTSACSGVFCEHCETFLRVEPMEKAR